MTLKHGPHSYKLLREEPYTRKMDGVETVLLVWEMVRRCEIHRHPGKRAGRRP